MINLENYKNVATALCVRIQVNDSTVIRFSDYATPLTINSELYTGIGKFVSITTTNSELRSTAGQITVTITGLPNSAITDVLNMDIKGSDIKIYRVMLNPTTNEVLNIAGNPVGRFFGFVNNYTIDEEYDIVARTASMAIAFVCNSTQQFLENKVAGRKTNPRSQKSFYSTDTSMDRVPNLVGANFNFGVPK